MGRVIPFSEIDLFLKDLKLPVGCIVDTQLLVASVYELHTFYEEAEFIHEKLSEYEIPIFSTVTTRQEFVDITRRITISEVVADMCLANTKWRLTESARLEAKRIKA
ncbi:MAG: hypothetical protein AABZ31_08285, partial [Bdellovibrionota bacterium]